MGLTGEDMLLNAAVDGQEVKYGMEGSNIGTRTEARLKASSLISPLRCQINAH